MTKITTLAELQGKETKQEKKPIELVYYISDSGLVKALNKPTDYLDIILICDDYTINFDLIFCKGLTGHFAYLGHWNDGVI